MKLWKWTAVGLAVALLCSLTAFAMKTTEAQPGTGATASEGQGIGMVADAAMYRGEVTKLEAEGKNTVMTLRQVQGTNFGSPTLTVRISPDTKQDLSGQELTTGAYVEVFYGVAWGPETQQAPLSQQTHEAISVKLLTPAQFAVFNGEVTEVLGQEYGAGTRMSLLMKPIGGGEEVVFHISDETQIYMDESDLKPGARLNLFTTGARTMSIPAQGSALEIRPYYDPLTDETAMINIG